MNKGQTQKLRRHHGVLTNIKRTIESEPKSSMMLRDQTIALIDQQFTRLLADIPHVVPPFVPSQYHSHEEYYWKEPVLAYLDIALGTVRALLDDEEEPSPLVKQKTFPFIRDKGLRRIIERDYDEIQKGGISGCWKSVIILSGGAIEGILADLLLQNESRAMTSPKRGKGQDILSWGLSELIDTALDLKLVSPGISSLSNGVRSFRNLVHPGNELRTGVSFDESEAKIAVEVIQILHRELS